jgi:hypothetical protein
MRIATPFLLGWILVACGGSGGGNGENQTPTVVGTGLPSHAVGLTTSDIVIALRNFFDDAEDDGDLSYTLEEGLDGGAVVTANLDNATDELTLSPAADGTVTIVVRGTDRGGLFVESSFDCRVDESIITAKFGAERDNTLYEGVGLSNGVGEHFFVGKTNSMSEFAIRRGLIRFDLSSIPTGATVLSARLVLNLSKTQSTDISVTLHRVKREWGEAGSHAPVGREGEGATALTGDATWIHPILGGPSWLLAGGEFVIASSGEAVVSEGPNMWSGNGMVVDLQGWIDGSVSNHGWILLGGETVDGSAKRFDTKENQTADNRPLLEIDYEE